jgi:hypothetical protein
MLMLLVLLLGGWAYPNSYDYGRVYVLYGGAALTNLFLDNSLPTSKGFMITGQFSGAKLGWSISGNFDFNGDGYKDILVGIASYRYGITYAVGAVCLIYGGPNLITINLDSALPTLGLSRKQGMIFSTEIGGPYYGLSVSSIGDFNNDNYADFAIGYWASYYAVYLIYGGNYTHQNNYVDLSNAADPFRKLQKISYASCPGHCIYSNMIVSSAGDFNGDGISDMLIGQSMYNLGTYAGIAFLLYGRTNGTTATDFRIISSRNPRINDSSQNKYRITWCESCRGGRYKF